GPTRTFVVHVLVAIDIEDPAAGAVVDAEKNGLRASTRCRRHPARNHLAGGLDVSERSPEPWIVHGWAGVANFGGHSPSLRPRRCGHPARALGPFHRVVPP